MRKLFISFITAILLTSCSADSLMKETELDLTDTEKVYSDITLTRKVAYDLYARMRLTMQRTMEPEIQPVPEVQSYPNLKNL